MELIEKFKTFLEFEKNNSDNTIDGYGRDLNQFFEFIKIDPTEVSEHHVVSFLTDRRKEGLSPTTTNRKLSAIKAFYRFLVRNRIVTFNPAENIEVAKTTKKLPETLKVEDIKNMLDKIDNLRDRVMIELLFATGIRREELAELKVNSVDFVDSSIRVIGKGDKERVIPVHPHVMENLKILLQQKRSEWVFPSRHKRKGHISTRQVNDIISKWGKEANISGATPHKFRHTFGATLFENGADIKSIQDMLGHVSIDTTNIYTKINHKRNKEEYMKHHPMSKEEE
ncbi:tyrosine recombinase XerC subunit [Anaerovirgula multivorans]|uniref:Tyrosine recombinase XerC subunit n=1 Tax=Anaerovirgula multivorans TaxID=312168 RepID=A0A239CPS8_9FIRM|nr:site-specific tyrosine recombinase/integron integrase [Anaerovirgula multivorans]SNS21393.1 tyrosine recombinase XerC subunit [Anaerovirgula multivorans]